MASDREAAKAAGRTTIATATLEGLVADARLMEKYSKVAEDPGVILFRTDVGWPGYMVHIESRSRIVKQAAPRKDWRNLLDKALTIWIEGREPKDVDPL